MVEDLLFEVQTKLGFSVRVTKNYRELIVAIKRPVLRRREQDIRKVFEEPDAIKEGELIGSKEEYTLTGKQIH